MLVGSVFARASAVDSRARRGVVISKAQQFLVLAEYSLRGPEATVNDPIQAKRLPIDVREALKAICTTGKGRCWHCDAKLPKARRAIRDGWDVQRLDDYPVASIILVCPACLKRPVSDHTGVAGQESLPSATVLVPRQA